MYIYNITVKVTNDIAAGWLRWMQDEHMDAIISTGCFFEYRLLRLLEQDDSEGPTYAAQYFCHTLEDYNRYLNEFAGKMRDEGRRKFGEGYAAFRTVMEVV